MPVAGTLVRHDVTYAADLRVAPAHPRARAIGAWVSAPATLAGLAGVLATALAQTMALVGLSDARPDWGIRLKTPLTPMAYSAALIGSALVLNVLPFLQEAWRSARAKVRDPAPLD